MRSHVNLSPSEPPCTDPVQDQGGRRAGLVGCTLLTYPVLVRRPHAPCKGPSLKDSPEEGPSFLGDGHNLAPVPRPVEFHDAVDGLSLGKHHLIVRGWGTCRHSQSTNHTLSLVRLILSDLETPARLCTQGSQHSFSRSGGEPASTAPVCTLRIYVEQTQSFRRSEQLFVCFGGQQKGNAVSKQRLTHWVVDAITLAYQCQGEPCPLGVRAHSTWSVASSWALTHGVSLADICRAAGWATPKTFARFYNLCVEPVSSRVLGNIR
ncbi:Aflatoxin B1 aldehyde reductase member 2 [Labeo rohita]|uniref:Aflatoxin B1 aldehyde reductase member 2 n=1 Tax=Labeo rohita TaxID=84645 RepID=A0ABQ8LVS0_LABRO|nr:Aflatoxin B1 aldehyde reductase member 2 [Labeo rohita]